MSDVSGTSCRTNTESNKLHGVDSLRVIPFGASKIFHVYSFTEPGCTRQLDVVFVLDLSGSVFEEYRLTVDFAKEVCIFSRTKSISFYYKIHTCTL